MARTKLSEYSTTNSDNTDIENINIAEGCAPSGINNAIRELMVHLKEFQTGASGDAFTFAGGTLMSGTNTISGAAIISGNINSSGTNTFSGSNVMSFSGGSSASPSIYFASDTNTGIFSPAADTIAFAEGGAESMRIDSSGNVGIGVTPSAWGTASGQKAFQIGTGGFALSSNGSGAGDGSLTWNGYYNGTNWIYSYTGGAASRFRLNESGAAWFTAASGTAGNTISFTQAMTLDASGNLLVGATSADARVFAYSSSGTSLKAQNPSNVAQLLIGYNNTSYNYIDADNNIFRSGNGTERMRIDSSGNVGIGTTTPTSTYTSRLVSVAGSGTAALSLDAPTGTNSSINFYYNGSAKWTTQVLTTGEFRWFDFTAATERMRIDSSGNLLVGDTSAYSGSRLSVKTGNNNGTTHAWYAKNSSDTLLGYQRDDGLFNTGAATNSPYNFTTAGAANIFVDSSGTFYRSTSSLKYKTNVQNATHGLADLLKLRSVTYKGKNDGDKVYGGLIAEEIHEAGLTEFVQYAEDGTPDALNYGNMVSLCIKAIQEQQALITQLQADVALLKGA
jgi:hypothetical protein